MDDQHKTSTANAGQPANPPSKLAARRVRQGEALRENLAKRKRQGQAARPETAGPPTSAEPETAPQPDTAPSTSPPHPTKGARDG